MKLRDTMHRLGENAGVGLGLVGVICLCQASDLGWHALAAYQQHLGPHDIVEWDSRPKGGYEMHAYPLSTLIWTALAYLAGAVAALLVLVRRLNQSARAPSARR